MDIYNLIRGFAVVSVFAVYHKCCLPISYRFDLILGFPFFSS